MDDIKAATRVLGWAALAVLTTACAAFGVAVIGAVLIAVLTFPFTDPRPVEDLWVRELWPLWVGAGVVIGVRHVIGEARKSQLLRDDGGVI